MKRTLLFATFFIVACSKLYSQCNCSSDIVITNVANQPSTVNTCEDYVLAITVQNNTTATCQSVQIDIAFEKTQYVHTVPVTGVGDQHRLFNLPNIGPGASYTLSVTVHYDCSSIGSNQPMMLNIQDDICLAFGGTACAGVNQCFHLNYDLNTPYFVKHTQNVTAYANTPLSREFTLVNTGQNYFQRYFSFIDNMAPNTYLHFLGAEVSIIHNGNTTSVAIFTATSNLQISFDYTFFPTYQILSNDIILVREDFDVYGCPDNPIITTINYQLGCSISEVCPILSNNGDDVVLSVGAGAVDPNILVTRTEPSDVSSFYWDNSCTNSFTKWEFTFTNTGNVTLKNPVIILDHDNPPDFPFYTYIVYNDATHPINVSVGWVKSYTLLATQFTGELPHCLQLPGFTAGAIFEGRFTTVGDFVPNQQCTLSFYTYRCCPNDEDDEGTALHEFDIFNTGIYFNHWRVHMDGNTTCNPVIRRYSNDNNSFSLYGDVYLSANVASSPDLILQQDFEFPVPFLTARRDVIPPCGNPQEFTIKNIRFDTYESHGFLDQQLFQQGRTTAPTGEVIVRIQMDPGLTFDQTFPPYMISTAGPNVTWNSPGGFQFIGPYWEGKFPIQPTFATYADFQFFMSFSEFHYRMKPCCDGNNNPEFDVRFYFNPLPPQDNGSTCNPCIIPQSKTEENIQIICPGCPAPGIETDIVTLLRDPSSFGLYDSDNDGLADNTLTQISSTDQATQQNMRLSGSIAGDILNARMVGTFHDGQQNTYHNLTYGIWPFTPFQNIYLELQIPHAQDFNLSLVNNSVELLIAPNNCSGCTLTYHLTPAECVFQPLTDVFFFKTTIANIQNNATSSGACNSCTPYVFAIDDKFELHAQFRVCNNYLLPGSTYNDLDKEDNRFESDVFGGMYFSNSNIDISTTPAPYVNHTMETAEEGYAIQCNGTPVDECLLDITHLDPNDLYFCGGNGSIHRFYSIRTYTDATSDDQASSASNTFCDKAVNTTTVIAIGGNGLNVFPFEFRPPIIPADVPNPQFTVNIPVGFQSNGSHYGTFFYTFLPGCYIHNKILVRKKPTFNLQAGVHPLGHSSFSFAREIPPFDALVSDGCDDDRDVLADPDLYIGDEYFEEAYSLHLYPDCNVHDCEVEYHQNETQGMLYSFDQNNCIMTGPTAVDNQNGAQLETFTVPYLDINGNNNCPTTPFLSLSTGSRVDVSNNTVLFELDIQNNSLNTHCIVAPNVWIQVPNNSFLSNMSIVVDPVQTGYGCPLIPGTVIPPNNNQIFELGNFDCGSAASPRKCDLTLLATYINCQGEGDHDLNINFGWNCGPYPNAGTGPAYSATHYPVVPTDACYHAPEDLKVDEASVNFVVYDDPQFTQPNEFGYCQSSQFEACATSTDGGVNNIQVEIQLPPFMTLDLTHPVFFCDGNGNCTDITALVTGTEPTFNIDLQSLNTDLDYENNPSSEVLAFHRYFCIRYWAQPICGYRPSDGMPIVSFGATKFCGDIISSSNGPHVTISPTWTYSATLGNSCSPLCIATEIISSTNDNIVCADEITLTAEVYGGDGSETFLWVPGGETTQSITFTPTPGQTVYYFSVTVTSGTATATDDITLNLTVINSSGTECCIPPGFTPKPVGNDYDFSNYSTQDVFNLYGLSSPITTNNIILINGTFTVNRPLTFQSCPNIILGPNAQIIVQSPYSLSIIDGSVLSACSDMWQGMQVSTGGTLHIYDSFINDGLASVEGTGTPNIIIHGSHFDRNLEAIYLHDGNFSNAHVYANYFNCTSFLNFPNSTVFTKDQVLLQDALNVGIGDASFGPNEIVDGTFGIRSIRSNVSIDNCNFNVSQNTSARTAIGANALGVACFGCHFTLNVGVNAPCRISNYPTGIDVRELHDCNIASNIFEDNRTSILITTCKQRNLSITANSFARFNHGVSIIDPIWANVAVADNSFNQSGMHYDPRTFGNIGIEVQNSMPALVTLSIRNNEMWSVRNGIHLRNMNTGFVEIGNKIHYQVAPIEAAQIGRMYGIWLDNSTKVKVLNNQVDWNYVPSLNELDLMKGIVLEGSQMCTVKENTITKLAAGVDVLHDCSNSNLYCNEMVRCLHGIYFEPFPFSVTSLLTTQGIFTNNQANDVSWDNKWTTNAGMTKVDGSTWQGQQVIWVYYSPSAFTDYDPFLSFALLSRQPGNNHAGCSIPVGPMRGEERDRMFGSAVGDSTQTDGYDSLEFIITDKEAFFKQAKEDPSILALGIASDSIYQNEFDSLQTANIGYYETVKDLIEADSKSDAINLLQGIVDNNLIDENKKYVASLVANGFDPSLDLDSDTVVVLNSIANMHPFYGGEAVYWARAILQLDVTDYLPALRRSKNISSNQFIFKSTDWIFPNPSNGKFTFATQNPFRANEEIRIINPLQQIVQKLALPETQQIIEFDVPGIFPGIYQVIRQQGSIRVSENKLIIIK